MIITDSTKAKAAEMAVKLSIMSVDDSIFSFTDKLFNSYIVYADKQGISLPSFRGMRNLENKRIKLMNSLEAFASDNQGSIIASAHEAAIKTISKGW